MFKYYISTFTPKNRCYSSYENNVSLSKEKCHLHMCLPNIPSNRIKKSLTKYTYFCFPTI